MGVREAVRIVCAGSDMDFRSLAHQVVIVDAFIALAGSDVGQDLRKAAMNSRLDEGGAMGVVFSAANGNCSGIAIGVIVEGTARDATVCDVRSHGITSVPAARAGHACNHGRPIWGHQKDPIA